MIEELIPRVFYARDIAQKAHWATNSYAEHVALGEFYVLVISALDPIVEAHQGMTGSLVDAEVAYSPKVEDKSTAEWLRDEAEWIETNREIIAGGHNAVANMVDGLTAIYLTTAYKLEQLN